MKATMHNLFEPQDGETKSLMTQLIDAMTTGVEIADPAKLKKNAEGLTALFDALGSISSASAALSDINTAYDAEGNKTSTTHIRDTFVTMASLFGASSEKSVIPKINDIILGFSELTTRVPKIKSLKAANDFMVELIPLANNLAAMPSLANNVSEKIMAVQTSFETLTTFMNTAGSDPELCAAIALGKALSTDGKVTVQHENVQINLSVKVTLNADDIAAVLITEKQYFKSGDKWPLTP
jgi:hypothetical protein